MARTNQKKPPITSERPFKSTAIFSTANQKRKPGLCSTIPAMRTVEDRFRAYKPKKGKTTAPQDTVVIVGTAEGKRAYLRPDGIVMVQVAPGSFKAKNSDQTHRG